MQSARSPPAAEPFFLTTGPLYSGTWKAKYLEGQGDLVSRLIGIIRVNVWIIGVLNLLTKSP